MNRALWSEKLKSVGFITTVEAAQMLGMVQGGNTKETLLSAGLHPVVFDLDGDSGRQVTMWEKEELEKYVYSLRLKNGPVGGENNGGLLRQKIAKLQQSISELEDRISRLETSCFSA